MVTACEGESRTATPDPDEIMRYLAGILRVTDMRVDVLFLALVLLQKLQQALEGFYLTAPTWKATVVVCTIMAGKVWVDDSVRFNNKCLTEVLPTTVRHINRIEIYFLDALDWNLTVDQSQYADCFFGVLKMANSSRK